MANDTLASLGAKSRAERTSRCSYGGRSAPATSARRIGCGQVGKRTGALAARWHSHSKYWCDSLAEELSKARRPYQLHPDHRAIGPAPTEEVLAAANPRMFAVQLNNGLAPHRVPEVYLFGNEQPDVWVDIADSSAQKIAASACHRTKGSAASDVVDRMVQYAGASRSIGLRLGRGVQGAAPLLRHLMLNKEEEVEGVA